MNTAPCICIFCRSVIFKMKKNERTNLSRTQFYLLIYMTKLIKMSRIVQDFWRNNEMPMRLRPRQKIENIIEKIFLPAYELSDSHTEGSHIPVGFREQIFDGDRHFVCATSIYDRGHIDIFCDTFPSVFSSPWCCRKVDHTWDKTIRCQ